MRSELRRDRFGLGFEYIDVELRFHTVQLRGESKFEKCTLSVNPTFRGWGDNVIDVLKCIHLL